VQGFCAKPPAGRCTPNTPPNDGRGGCIGNCTRDEPNACGGGGGGCSCIPMLLAPDIVACHDGSSGEAALATMAAQERPAGSADVVGVQLLAARDLCAKFAARLVVS